MARSSDEDLQEKLPFRLLDNALDLLLSAAEAVRRSEGSRSLKEAVVHLSNGTEVLLKARLAMEHWSLIFSDIDKASFEKLQSGEFSSVSLAKAIGRLEKIADVSINDVVKGQLNDLAKFRNRLTHFTVELESAQIKALVAKAVIFCVDFCEQHDMTIADVEDKLEQIHKNLTTLNEYVEERMRAISSELEDVTVWDCPNCWQHSLVIDGGDVECRFCSYRAEPSKLAEREGIRYSVDCPECFEESTFTYVLHSSGGGNWICFSCGIISENYVDCLICGQVTYIPQHNDADICENCWLNIIARD